MTPNELLATRYLNLSLLIFAALAAHTVYRSLIVGRFRLWMFVLRDQIFEHCAAAGDPAQHPDFAWTRDELNGFIRSAHLINSGRLLPWFWVADRGSAPVAWPRDPFVARKITEARIRLTVFLVLAAPAFCLTTFALAVRTAAVRRATDQEQATRDRRLG